MAPSESHNEIRSALTQSEAGQSLKNTYRWLQFKSSETNEDWLKILGSTGRVDTHMHLFTHIALKFMAEEYDKFYNNGETFILGIILHDIGEAKINGAKYVGDVSAQVKTDNDEKEEYKIAKRAIRSLNLSDETKAKLQDAYNLVVKDPGDEKLHFAFKALEKAEYVLTAMRVYRNCKRLRAQGRPAMNEEMEKALVGRVLVIDLPKVLDVYIPAFPQSIGKFFKDNIPLIDSMFAYSLPWLETHDTWKDKDGKVIPIDHKALADAFRVKWEKFKNSKQNHWQFL